MFGLSIRCKDDIDCPWVPSEQKHYLKVVCDTRCHHSPAGTYDTEIYEGQNHLGPAANSTALLSRYDRSRHAQKPLLLDMRQPRQPFIRAAVSGPPSEEAGSDVRC
ncbi:hypothetical protein SCLCIDRAFT_1214977 [Scleroderma citrinum Foug A]|uniref:Uncharacterized protein n=1 Tax=Scleroderma citrinum Foug A TaxID=1036808 RepID=A0A0C3DP62_9AGAM|nr:hypothetical protein SCLCIDRAFT_1214977 [Scleroderma citrinum Foug A]